MTEQEVTIRFNSLPREIRTTIIGSEISTEINWLKREKKRAQDQHSKNIRDINERIVRLSKNLEQLKDD